MSDNSWQFFFNAFCAVIYALTVVERHNLVLSVAVADKVLLVNNLLDVS